MEEKNELEDYSESKSETFLCESRARSEIKEEKTFLWKLIWRRGERNRKITEKETKTFSWKLVKKRIKRVCFVTPVKNPENSRKVFNSLKGPSFPFFGSVLIFVTLVPFYCFWFCSDDGSLKGRILILAWAYLGLVWLGLWFKLVC